jgi:protein gp37
VADRSAIEWTDATWGPVVGCTKVSPGCDNCYAERFVNRFAGTPAFPNRFDTVTLRPQFLDLPLRWRKPRRIFVNSLADLFHDDVPDEYIAMVFAVMALARQHQFQVLTKRHGRMRSLLSDEDFRAHVTLAIVDRTVHEGRDDTHLAYAHGDWWPLPNVCLGVSVENQRWADIRIPALLDTSAAVRWVSAEPLLGPIELHRRYLLPLQPEGLPGLDWVIVGGESGPGARPMHPDWARSLRDQCVGAGVPYLFKQWGEYQPAAIEDAPEFFGGRAYNDPRGGRRSATIRMRSPKAFVTGEHRLLRAGDRTTGGVVCLDERTVAVKVGKHRAGRELDGRTWDEYPAGAA